MPALSLVRHTASLTSFALTAAFLISLQSQSASHTVYDSIGASSIRTTIAAGADSLDESLAALSAALEPRPLNAAAVLRIRTAFRSARVRYKRVEAVTEFYTPALAAAFNSRRQEVDDDDAPPPSTLAPSGFPALEALLYPSLARANLDSARRIVFGMRPLAARLHSLAPGLSPTPWQIIELSRLELARISTLGIAGFDAPRTGDAIREGADALDGMRALCAVAGAGYWQPLARERHALDSALAATSRYMREHPDFNSFNRLAFISVYTARTASALDSLRVASGTESVRIPRGWRADAPSVYAANAFDARAYAPSGSPTPSPALVALGARLFSERSLSVNGTRSCASCHKPDHEFTDGLVRAPSIAGHGAMVARHTPTIINAAFEPSQFADERAATLEDQALIVLRNPIEMGSSDARAAAALQENSDYVKAFAGAFAADERNPVTPLRVRQALAAYIRTLATMRSRFDRAVRGDTNALSPQERAGFTLFMGKAGCGTCHFAPLFNGNTPPLYMSSDVEVIGVPRAANWPSVLDSDSGRAGIDHLPAHLHAFKTPSLRNSAKSAPYMHNGAFQSLDQVIRFYDHGGALGAGARIANQTLSPDSLHLTASERKAIIAFIGSLSDAPLIAAH